MTREASIRRRVADANGVVGQCRDCGRDMGSNRNKFGLLVHAGHGQCTSCRSAIDRAKKKAGKLVTPTATLLPPTPAWMKKAPCATSGQPDAWFPDKGVSTKPARKICGSCRYVAPCLTWAVQNRERGIWGGLTEVERRGLDLFGDEDEGRLDGQAVA